MGSLEMFHSESKACPQDISDKEKKNDRTTNRIQRMTYIFFFHAPYFSAAS